MVKHLVNGDFQSFTMGLHIQNVHTGILFHFVLDACVHIFILLLFLYNLMFL